LAAATKIFGTEQVVLTSVSRPGRHFRPTCENCNRPLAPDAPDAMICSYECTFCRDCVGAVLSNVCPNCGGGFERRPIRPTRAWIEGETRGVPLDDVVHKPVDPTAHEALVARIGGRSPSER
jgi:hypothetical protein